MTLLSLIPSYQSIIVNAKLFFYIPLFILRFFLFSLYKNIMIIIKSAQKSSVLIKVLITISSSPLIPFESIALIAVHKTDMFMRYMKSLLYQINILLSLDFLMFSIVILILFNYLNIFHQ